MFKGIIISCLILCSGPLWAFFKTDISLVYKKKVVKGLVLTQEFHKTVTMWPKEIVEVESKSGVRCQLELSFKDDVKTYGPSDKLRLSIKLINAKLDKELFSKEKIVLRLNSKKSFTFISESGDELNLTVAPKVF